MTAGADDLASREMVSAAKGRDLMVDRYAEIMGLESSPTGRELSAGRRGRSS